jgi:7,8-dihydropterin-6-yl-methyl-4-(beta-D-ribofuranosyl)aminobenzene 5'-phosphate synthase
MHLSRLASAFLLSVLLLQPSGAEGSANPAAKAIEVQVTILSSNLAGIPTVGEWGLSALVEVDGQCILFDAGRNPETVLRNAEELDVDLSCVSDIVLSHFHFDHTTGLLPILEMLREEKPDAVRRVHVAQGFFLNRRIPSMTGDAESNQMIGLKSAIEAAGAEFVQHTGPAEIAPGVWVTGPVARPFPEKNYPVQIQVQLDGEWVEDHVPESQGLTVMTDRGHIVLLGCGHSGVVNLLSQIQSDIADLPIHALMGGLHLFNASDETLQWTAERLREIGVENLMAGHCTGIEPMFRLREGLGLTRKTAVVGAVGSRFVYGEGIHATAIAM